MFVSDNNSPWPKYIALTVLTAFLTSVAAKSGEFVVELAKEKFKPKQKPKKKEPPFPRPPLKNPK